jgi:transposase
MGAGRPTKLTLDVQEKICQAIQMGATYVIACQYAGLAYNTFNEWMKAGESASTGRFHDFCEAVNAAEGRGAIKNLALIDKAAQDGAWQAAAWKLERRYPKDYGRRMIDMNHSGKIDVRSMTDAELESIIQPD